MRKQVHSIMLTSGTLTPFNYWECELRIPFEIKLDNKHVVDARTSVIAGIIPNADDGTPFNFNYTNRDNQALYLGLCNLLIHFSKAIAHGILVVFPSYPIMNKLRAVMNQNGLGQDLSAVKHVCWESQLASDFQHSFKEFSTEARTQKGAIMFAVCRGKVSEGIDLNDELCRAVFVVGIPFPPTQDSKVKAKQDYVQRIYNDATINQYQKISSQEWYMQQAIRSTNQAIGRVIRHINDYG